MELQPEAFSFIKKEALTQLFSREICENFKNTYFTEHFRTTAFFIETPSNWLLPVQYQR